MATDLQKQFYFDFTAAKRAGDREEAERIALAYLAEEHEDPSGSAIAAIMQMYIDRINASRMEKEGHDYIRTLTLNLEKEWDSEQVASALQSIDELTAAGWAVCADDREIIAECRQKFEKEAAAANKRRKREKKIAELEEAVRHKDAAAITAILASRELREKRPDFDLLDRAGTVLDTEETTKKRLKGLLIAVGIIGFALLLAVAAKSSKNKAFDDKCEAEAEKLALLLNSFDPIEQLSSELKFIRVDEPELLYDNRIKHFSSVLKTLIDENFVRTNEIAKTISSMDAVMERDWNTKPQNVTNAFEYLDSKLMPRDIYYRARVLELKTSWDEHLLKHDSTRKLAGKYCTKLVAILDSVSKRITSSLTDEELPMLISRSEDAIAKWQSEFEHSSPQLDEVAGDAIRTFKNACQNREQAIKALADFKDTARAIDIVQRRDDLYRRFSSFSEIAEMPRLPYSEDNISALLNGTARHVVFCDQRGEPGITGKDRETIKYERENGMFFRVRSAGKLHFDPLSGAYKRNKGAIVLGVNDGVAKNHPLYVLRRDGGTLIVKRAFIVQKGKWKIATAEIKEELIPGEPLFQITFKDVFY